MRVRDLGALVVVQGAQEVSMAGAKSGALLAALVIHVNQRVSVDTLMSVMWGDEVSAGSTSTLLSHIFRLRQILEPSRGRRETPSVLVNDSDGYRLIGGPATVDSLALAEAADEVRDLLAAGDTGAAVRTADAALALWRGQPYGVFGEADWAQLAVSRLDELRGQVQERRIEALVASGALETALSDLPALIDAMPYRESLRQTYMLALHSVGRTEQALQVYHAARRTLVEDVGIEPGQSLQNLHQSILQGDAISIPQTPLLERPSRSIEIHLPSVMSAVIGRTADVELVSDLVTEHRLVTIAGVAGCGKTRLAIEVAQTTSYLFPDGVWFVDLTAVSDPALVVEVIASTIGFAASVGATPLDDLRRFLRTRRMLLVLDNCEHVLDSAGEVVEATLGRMAGHGGPQCSLLLTSREPIGTIGETVWTLGPLELPDGERDAASSPAVELFVQRLKEVAPRVSLDERTMATIVDICVSLDGLPLPIELAAARALSHSVDDISVQVADDPSRLSRVGRRRDHRATVKSAVEWSYRLLDPEEQRAHRQLSVLPGSFTARPAAAVLGLGAAGAETDTDDVDEVLARLVHRSMLSSDATFGGHSSTSFRQLATVRSHAWHALVDSGDNDECFDRRDRWTLGLMSIRPPLGDEREIEWYKSVDADYSTVRATLGRLLDQQGTADGGRLAYRLAYYWYLREGLIEAARWLELSARVFKDSGTVDALLCDLWRSAVLTLQRRIELVRARAANWADQIRATPSDRLLEVGEALVGLAMAAYIREEADLLVGLHHHLAWVAAECDDAGLAVLTDAVGCCALLASGQLSSAVDLAMSVQRRAADLNNPMAAWISTAPLIMGALRAGRPEEGIPWIDLCATMYLKLGRGSVGLFAETKANFVAQTGDFARAARYYAAARRVTKRAGLDWPNRDVTEGLLAATRHGLTKPQFEQAWQEGELLSPEEIFTVATI